MRAISVDLPALGKPTQPDVGEQLELEAHRALPRLLQLIVLLVPLCEIVSEPDVRSAEEAAEYVRAMRTLVRYLGIGDGNMEEGSLRCDANVSLRPRGATALGTKTEIKNMNSFKNVRDAIEHEVKRQAALLDRRRARRPGDAALGRGARR